MNGSKQVDRKYLISAILLLLLASFGFIFKERLLYSFELFITSNVTIVVVAILSIVFSFLSKLKGGKIQLARRMSFRDFRSPVEEIFSFVSNPIYLVFCISLGKGLFLQIFKGQKNFIGFSDPEIGILVIVVVYLVWDSVNDLLGNINEVIFTSSHKVGIPQVISEPESQSDSPTNSTPDL